MFVKILLGYDQEMFFDDDEFIGLTEEEKTGYINAEIKKYLKETANLTWCISNEEVIP